MTSRLRSFPSVAACRCIMGAGASSFEGAHLAPGILSCGLKKLPEQVEHAIYELEKFCLILDPNELATRYLKYQLGSFVSSDDIANFNSQYLNRALVGALRYGRTLSIKLPSLEGWELEGPSSIFQPGLFPKELLNRQQFLQPEVWTSVLKPELGDPPAEDLCVSSEFVFCLCVTSPGTVEVPASLANLMHVFRITDQPVSTERAEGNGEDVMDCVAGMLGAAEIVRNSLPLVECAFDGDLEGVKEWLEKGFHIESCDGRKHTALSEAACQGHAPMCAFLIEQGADPNALSDTGRSPLWRACFSGHLETACLLLESGGNPECRDAVSMESAFDVARTDEIRAVLSGWNQQKTEMLMQARKRAVLAKLEERIQTSQQREEFARHKIRAELVLKAEAGDVEAVKAILLMVADEAEKSGLRPRATAEARSESGQSLLSLAAQHDHVDLATWLLTHHKSCDKDRWDLAEGQQSAEAKVCKANVNSRDLKGWNCVCIAGKLALLSPSSSFPHPPTPLNKSYNLPPFFPLKRSLSQLAQSAASAARARRRHVDAQPVQQERPRPCKRRAGRRAQRRDRQVRDSSRHPRARPGARGGAGTLWQGRSRRAGRAGHVPRAWDQRLARGDAARASTGRTGQGGGQAFGWGEEGRQQQQSWGRQQGKEGAKEKHVKINNRLTINVYDIKKNERAKEREREGKEIGLP